MPVKIDEVTPEFSFEGAHLYRNTRTSQYVLAVKIRNCHLNQIKKLSYLKSSIRGQYTMPGDFVVLRNGRLSFTYGQTQFNDEHVLVC